jgi:hypothetical protein
VTDTAFNVGDYVEFELHVADDAPPEFFCGHVTWSRPHEGQTSVGLKFDFPSPFRQKRVQFLVNRLSGVSRPPESPLA